MSEEKSVRSNSVNTKIREGRTGGAPGTEADTPLQLMEETTVEQIFFPAPCGRDGSKTGISLQTMERNTSEQISTLHIHWVFKLFSLRKGLMEIVEERK